MKIRHPWAIKAIAFTVAHVVKAWMGTLHVESCCLGTAVDPVQLGQGERFIYPFWHENALVALYRYSRANIWTIISRHSDGELLTAVGRYFGLKTVRGSTSRGGVDALRRLLRESQDAHLALTPDGPRGPRQHLQPGVVYLAARTGLPIVPSGIGYQRAWRLRSWDRFAIPRPWSDIKLVIGSPMRVPADLDNHNLEPYRLQVEQAMHDLTQMAEDWAVTGQKPIIPPPAALAG